MTFKPSLLLLVYLQGSIRLAETTKQHRSSSWGPSQLTFSIIFSQKCEEEEKPTCDLPVYLPAACGHSRRADGSTAGPLDLKGPEQSTAPSLNDDWTEFAVIQTVRGASLWALTCYLLINLL